MTSVINFESLSYNPFSIHESLINSEHDPDINFYQDISTLETQTITVALMIFRTTFNVSWKIPFPFYI